MKEKEIHIIGAGFSGLTIAYYLSKQSFSNIIIFEKNDKPGGMISTKDTKYGSVESAANTIIMTDYLAELLKDINLTPQYPQKESRKRFIYRKGEFKRWPLDFKDTFVFIKGLLRLIFAKKRYKPQTNQTIHHWTTEVFNNNISDFLISPGLQGIYASSGNHLSASVILKKYFQKTRNKKERSQGIVSFKDGMEELPISLSNYLKENGVTFKYNHQISHMNEDVITVIATSLSDAKTLHTEIFNKFYNVPLKDVSTATIFFDKDKHIVPGFGVLYPRDLHIESLGSLMNDHIFSDRSKHSASETWIIENNKCSDQNIIKKILKDRRTVIKRADKAKDQFITTWKDAFPLYGLELERSLKKKDNLTSKHIYLTGNYLGQLGLSGILAYNRKLSKKIRKKYE